MVNKTKEFVAFQEKPAHNINAYLSSKQKRIFDITVSMSALLCVSPVMLLCVALVGGRDVLFKHERVGRNGRRFSCLKIRTMYVDSVKVLDDVLRSNPDLRKEWDKNHKLKNDPRITRVGKLLRKLSLDELPQLLNVLAGDMSIVGPRPVTFQELDRYGESRDAYLACKPGIAGSWQALGRGKVTYSERVKLDVDYASTASMKKDVELLFLTALAVLRMRGSY